MSHPVNRSVGSCPFAIATPGTEIELKEATGEGQAFLSSLDYWDRQMVLAILGSVRGILESTFGSRADSGTGQDVMGLVKRAARRAAARAVQDQLIYLSIALNFGEEAREFCPTVSLGGPEQHDLAEELSAWTSAGYRLAASHPSEVDARLGLTPRAAGEESVDGGKPLREPGSA